MHKVLIVEDNAALIKFISIRLLEYKDEFEIITASNGLEAINVLKKTSIALVVTDLKMPKMDGLALLAFINRNFSKVPCIVLTAHGTPEIKQRIRKNILGYIEKPIKANDLGETIRKALNIKVRNDFIRVMSVANYLQIIEIEQKTCFLEIKSGDDPKGLLYFEKGVLYGAAIGKLRGLDAALKIILFESSKIYFKKLPIKKVKQRIHTNLSDLLLQAIRLNKKSAPSQIAMNQGDSDKPLITDKKDHKEKKLNITPQTIPDAKTHNTSIFYLYLNELKKIKGYKASGIMNAKGEIEASDTSDKHFVLAEMGTIFHSVFRLVKNINHKICAGSTKELYCNASEGMILVAFTPSDFYTSVYAFAIFESGSNRTLIKLTLDKIIYKMINQ
ncbi:response regulator [Desulfococcaceae bacterium HSG9]|nr:response regulator [Desulfococcaceae bacterium HSG9]